MKGWNVFLILIIILGVSPLLVLGVPSSKDAVTDTGFEILHPIYNTIAEDVDFDFHMHLINRTNGVPIHEDTSCYLDVYNQSGNPQGSYFDDTPDTGFDYEMLISASNISTSGEYNFVGHCNNSVDGGGFEFDIEVTVSGREFTTSSTWVYLFSILMCLVVSFLSLLLIIKRPITEDYLDDESMYKLKKRDEVKFYANLIGRKLWIVGSFGVYLSLLSGIALLSQLSYNLGIFELVSIFNIMVEVMAWGLIPFVIFWIIYLILFFVKSTKDALLYQYGKVRSMTG